MPDSTDRVGIPFPELDEMADGPLYIGNLAQYLDSRIALDDQGPIASRPVSTPATPGVRGRYYFGTDTGLVYRDHGTGWTIVTRIIGEDEITNFEIAPLTVRATELADNSVIRRTIGDLAVGAAEIDNSVVGYSHIANGLKPSQGAGASQEALRALGSSAGMAAAGIHGSTHRPNGSDPLLDVILSVAQFKAITPQNGMIARVLVAGSEQSVWTLMYDSTIGDAYKWRYLAGNPLTTEYGGNVDEANAAATLNTWQPMNVAGGIQVTTPLSGIYRTNWRHASMGQFPTGGSTGPMYMGLEHVGGAGLVYSSHIRGDTGWFQIGTTQGQNDANLLESHDVARTVTEGRVVRVVLYHTGPMGTGSIRVSYPAIWQEPVRVSQ